MINKSNFTDKEKKDYLNDSIVYHFFLWEIENKKYNWNERINYLSSHLSI